MKNPARENEEKFTLRLKNDENELIHCGTFKSSQTAVTHFT
jgi:hypothetical protein